MSVRWLHELRTSVRATVGKGATVLVGVSGGGDSMALLHGLARSKRLGLRLIVAHLDHGLRAESGVDAAFVGQAALDLNLFCLREKRDVSALVAQSKQNLEEVARQKRHRFFQEAAHAVGADAIALAHTADDQAETVLMHLLRGAGADGLRGMLPFGPAPFPDAPVPLLRPLLGVTRATLRTWLTREGLAWREDATNADTTRTRSRLRTQLLPLLEAEQPQIRARLAASAARLAEDEILIAPLVEAAWQRHVAPAGESLVVSEGLRDEPVALQRRLLRRVHAQLHPRQELSARALDALLALLREGETGQQVALPGGIHAVRQRGGGLSFAPPRGKL